MLLIYIKRDNRMDGAEDWEEKVVAAESVPDALACCGFDSGDGCEIEVLGSAVPGMERGIVCWGLHDHERFECLFDGCARKALFACDEHLRAVKAFYAEEERQAKQEREDLREVAFNTAQAWEALWKPEADPDAIRELAFRIAELKRSAAEHGSESVLSEALQNRIVEEIIDAGMDVRNAPPSSECGPDLSEEDLVDQAASYVAEFAARNLFIAGIITREQGRKVLEAMGGDPEDADHWHSCVN